MEVDKKVSNENVKSGSWLRHRCEEARCPEGGLRRMTLKRVVDLG